MRFSVHVLIYMDNFSHPFREREATIKGVYASKVSAEAVIPEDSKHWYRIETYNVLGWTNKIAKLLIGELTELIANRKQT